MDIKCGDNYGAYTVAYLNDPLRSEQLKQAANEAITDMEDIYDILNKDIAFTYDKM